MMRRGPEGPKNTLQCMWTYVGKQGKLKLIYKLIISLSVYFCSSCSTLASLVCVSYDTYIGDNALGCLFVFLIMIHNAS